MSKKKRKHLLQKYDARKQGWLKMIKLFVLMVVAVFLIFRFVIGVSLVSGVSMNDTIRNGSVVVYTRIGNTVQRGQIVAVSLPSGEFYVKRVIAIGGDTVDLRDGVLYVNGEAQTEAYALGETWSEEGAFRYPLTVADGDLFVLGDNREQSIDSRFFGSISRRQIAGVIRVIFKFPQIQFL